MPSCQPMLVGAQRKVSVVDWLRPSPPLVGPSTRVKTPPALFSMSICQAMLPPPLFSMRSVWSLVQLLPKIVSGKKKPAPAGLSEFHCGGSVPTSSAPASHSGPTGRSPPI